MFQTKVFLVKLHLLKIIYWAHDVSFTLKDID